MPHTTTRTFSEVLKKNFKSVIKHWTPLSVVAGLLATGLGLLSLYSYTSAIARPDLFMFAIDAKTALVVWLLMVVLSMVGYSLVLTTTTWLYGISVSLFAESQDNQKRAALYLLIPVLLGFLTFLLLSFFLLEYLPGGWIFLIVAVLTTVSCTALLKFNDFEQLVVNNTENKSTTPPTPPSKRMKAGFMFTLCILIFATAVSAIFPTLLTINAYVGDDTPYALGYVAAMSAITLCLTLAPVVIYYRVSGDIYKRISYGFISIIFVFCAFVLLMPGAMGSITYAAARGLDVRQTYTARFILGDDITLEDLNNTAWKTRVSESGKIEVRAFQLFSFGDTLLLCPGDLVQSSLNTLRHYTAYCVSTKHSKVNRKPRTVRFAKADYCRSIALCQAGAWKGWAQISRTSSHTLPIR